MRFITRDSRTIRTEPVLERSEGNSRDPRAGKAIVSVGRKKGCLGPELEEVEGGRCDGVLTEPQVRQEKEVPVTQVAGVELSIRAMPVGVYSPSLYSLSCVFIVNQKD
jgi:hypothetical protein